MALFQIVAMIFCFGGIAIVTFSQPKIEDSEEEQMSEYEIGIILCFSVIFLFSLSSVTTRRLRSMHFSIIQFYLGLIGLLVSTIWLLIEMQQPDAPAMF